MKAATYDLSLEAGTAFMTTDWSLVASAQRISPAAGAALEKICRVYWRPLYAFVRREGCNSEEAQDLTQAFFARFLERRDLDVVRREKGRLRSYLLASLKNFLTNERNRAMTIKRGEGRRPIPLDDLVAHASADLEPANNLSADRIFERRWALTVLEQVISQLEKEYRATGKSRLFERFKKFLADEDGPSQAEIGRECSMNENAVKQAFHRFRQRYREILREEVARTVTAPGDVEDELRYLIAVLRA
ncbi:MAG: sigma-70 family RNA polymerase sigma factor [Verrucomicrobiota bacterium]